MIDAGTLARYLSAHLPGFVGPAAIRQFAGGQSNPTFLIETPARKYVLRKKPPGVLLPTAHQIEREFRVLRALQGTGVPAPTPLVLCEDADVIGTAFYVMDFVDGGVFTDPALPDVAPGRRAEIFRATAAALARLHGVDWRAPAFEGLGRPENYLARQVERWTKQYMSTADDPPAAMAPLATWLRTNIPATSDTAFTHGDYRIGNLLIDTLSFNVAAVVDWELATIGDPLADLAYLCLAYHIAPGNEVFPGLHGLDLRARGIPSEMELVETYRAASGRAVTHWRFYLAFSCFRLAAIAHGVHARALQGNAADARAMMCGPLAQEAAAVGAMMTM